MSEEITANFVPALAPTFRFQWEEAQDCFVILYPEGMVKLSQSAGVIMEHCDGNRNVDEIINILGEKFPGVDLSNDVINFIKQAKDNGWIKDGKN